MKKWQLKRKHFTIRRALQFYTPLENIEFFMLMMSAVDGQNLHFMIIKCEEIVHKYTHMNSRKSFAPLQLRLKKK